MSKSDKDLVKTISRESKISILESEFPNGKLTSDKFTVGSVDGQKGGSLSYYIDRDYFKDYARPEQYGNLVDLLALKKRIAHEAVRELLRQRAGTGKPPEGKREAVLNEEAMVPVPDDAPPPGIEVGSRHSTKPDYILRKIYHYRDCQKRTLLFVCRYECTAVSPDKDKPDKIVIPRTYYRDGGWRWKGLGSRLNPLYRLDLLADRLHACVVIVEGEKAADAAAVLFPDYVAIAWLGGTGQLGKADFSPLRGRPVTYWPDADTAGAGSVEVISRRLAEVGVSELRVVTLPPDLPKGWDVADDLPPGLDPRALLRNAATPAAIQRALLRDQGFEALLQRLAYNVETDQFVDLLSGYRARSAQMNNLFRHSASKSMAARLLEHGQLHKVQRFSYMPGNENRIVRVDDDLQVLNLWRPSGAVRQAGDARPFFEHLRYLCTTDEEFEHLANMLAFMAQYPGGKLKSAIVLVGPPGSGKSFVGHVMRRILGAHNTSNVESTDIKSDYNGYMEAKQLVIVEEVMALGRIEIMNRLKPLITQPMVRVNEKYLVAYEIENRANFIFLSNHEDALKLEDGDRRYFIVISDRAPEAPDYYDRLWAWEAQHLGVILDWLLSRDLTGFKPEARPPATEGRRRMIDAGRSDAEVLVADLVENYAAPFQHDLVELAEVRRVISDSLSGGRGTTITRPALTKAMRAAGAVDLGQKKGTVDGVDVRKSLWAVRNADRYRSMSPQALIEEYMKSLGLSGGKPKAAVREILL